MKSTLSIIIISAIFLLASIGNVSAADYSPIAWEEVDSQGYYSNPTYAYDNGFNDTSTYALIGTYGVGDEVESIAYIWDTENDGTSNAILYYTWQNMKDHMAGEIWIDAWNYSSGNWSLLRRDDSIFGEGLAIRGLDIAPDYISSTGEIKIKFTSCCGAMEENEIYLYDVYITLPPDIYRPIAWEEGYSDGSYGSPTSAYDDGYNDTYTNAWLGGGGGWDIYFGLESLIYIWDTDSDGTSNATLYYTWEVPYVAYDGYAKITAWNYDSGSWKSLRGGVDIESLATRSLDIAPDYISSTGEIKIEFRAGFSYEEETAIDLYDVYISAEPGIPDTTPPTVTITSPQNKPYNNSSVELSFYADEPTRWAGYKLDKGSWVTVIGGSTTLTNLSDGQHKVKVSMADLAGNHGYSTVYFTVDTTRPTVTIASPQNKTYNTSSVDLSFYANEPTRWAGYKLDKGPWVTVTGGSTTLTNLSNGRHKIKVSMTDLAGNHGSALVWFNVRVSGSGRS